MKVKGGYISIVSGLLIFFGYIFNHSYYSRFGIDIWIFFNTGELIFSFLPFLIPLLITALGIVIVLIFGYSDKDKYGEKVKGKGDLVGFLDKVKISDALSEIYDTIIKGIFKPIRKGDKIRTEIAKRIFFLIVIIIFAAIIKTTLFDFLNGYLNQEGVSYFYRNEFIVSCFLWGVITYFIIRNTVNKTYRYLRSNISTSIEPLDVEKFVAFFYLLFIIGGSAWLYGSYKAFLIKDNKPLYYVEVQTINGVVKSNDSIIFIGKTKDYYFLRDIINESNIILHQKDIQKVILKEIDNTSYFEEFDALKKERSLIHKLKSFFLRKESQKEIEVLQEINNNNCIDSICQDSITFSVEPVH